MTMDFTPSPHAGFAAALQAEIDAAMIAENAKQPPRTYLGGSRLGEACLRALVYEYAKVPRDPDKGFDGPTLRIFDMGHDGEARMAAYLRLAGFNLVTHGPDGKQFGFGVAWDEARQRYRIAGHIDGAMIDGPHRIGGVELRYPFLWENKALGAKSFGDMVRKGVRKSKPVYYTQIQIYQGHMVLSENPALFTCLNRDTGEIYAELVPFDAAEVQAASDRGVRVISAATPEELPRVATQSDDFRCKFCNWAQRCWSAPAATTQAPAWFGQR